MEVHNPLYLKYAKKYTDNTPTKKGALHLRYFTTDKQYKRAEETIVKPDGSDKKIFTDTYHSGHPLTIGYIISHLRDAKEKGINICIHALANDVHYKSYQDPCELYSLFQSEDEWFVALTGYTKEKYLQFFNKPNDSREKKPVDYLTGQSLTQMADQVLDFYILTVNKNIRFYETPEDAANINSNYLTYADIFEILEIAKEEQRLVTINIQHPKVYHLLTTLYSLPENQFDWLKHIVTAAKLPKMPGYKYGFDPMLKFYLDKKVITENPFAIKRQLKTVQEESDVELENDVQDKQNSQTDTSSDTKTKKRFKVFKRQSLFKKQSTESENQKKNDDTESNSFS